jgi:hypothetical protein
MATRDPKENRDFLDLYLNEIEIRKGKGESNAFYFSMDGSNQLFIYLVFLTKRLGLNFLIQKYYCRRTVAGNLWRFIQCGCRVNLKHGGIRNALHAPLSRSSRKGSEGVGHHCGQKSSPILQRQAQVRFNHPRLDSHFN